MIIKAYWDGDIEVDGGEGMDLPDEALEAIGKSLWQSMLQQHGLDEHFA